MPRANLTTKKFGLLTPLHISSYNRRRVPMYECNCDCGNSIVANYDNLVSGHTKSCGCLKHRPTVKRVDLTNQRFGMLTALKVVGVNSHFQVLWLCICDCGNDYIGRAGRLQAKEVQSCGCQEGVATHGLSRTAAYDAHKGMVHRCYSPKARNFDRYGGRGINICERWLSVKNFIADMGQPPNGLTIERINNDGGYWCGQCEECQSLSQPRNCRWDTYVNQQRNKCSNRAITARGKTMLLVEWAQESGIAKSTITNRLKRGWDAERSVTEPPRPLRSRNGL